MKEDSNLNKYDDCEEFCRESFFLVDLVFKKFKDVSECETVEQASDLLWKAIDEYKSILSQKFKEPHHVEIKKCIENIDEIKSPIMRRVYGELHQDELCDANTRTGEIIGKSNVSSISIQNFIFDTSYKLDLALDKNKNNERVVNIFKDYGNEFVELATCFSLIFNYKFARNFISLAEGDRFVSGMSCLLDLLKMSVLRTTNYYTSNDYSGYLIKALSSKNIATYWSLNRKNYQLACGRADKEWAAGDRRKHHEMAKYLAEDINESMDDEILAGILPKYPDKKFNKESQENFDKEFKKLRRQKHISSETLKKSEEFRCIAKKYGKYHVTS